MKILEMIKNRKLEMIGENQALEQQKAQLTAQLNQTNSLLIKQSVELQVLTGWETKLKEEANVGK